MTAQKGRRHSPNDIFLFIPRELHESLVWQMRTTAFKLHLYSFHFSYFPVASPCDVSVLSSLVLGLVNLRMRRLRAGLSSSAVQEGPVTWVCKGLSSRHVHG
jgi:hypothetical protein